MRLPLALVCVAACSSGASAPSAPGLGDAGSSDAEPETGGAALVVSDEATPFPKVTGGLGPGWRTGPALAAGNGVRLLAWQDARADADGDVFAARIAPDGTLLDQGGLGIALALGRQERVHVAWGAGQFLVTWADLREGHSSVYGARVRPDGTVLDPGGVRLTEDSAYESDVAFASGRFVLAYAVAEGLTRPLRLRFIDAGLTPLGPASTIDDEPRGAIRLASDGTTALVLYDKGSSTPTANVAAVAAGGAIVHGASWPVDPLSPLALAGDAAGFVAASGSTQVRARRLAPDGTLVNPSDVAVVDAAIARALAITRDGAGWLFAVTMSATGSAYDVQTARLDDGAAAAVPGAALSAVVDDTSVLALSSGPGARLAAWSGAAEVFTTRLDSVGAKLDDAPRSAPRGAPAEVDPALAAGGVEPLIAVCERSRDDARVRVARLAADGASLATAERTIAGAKTPSAARGGGGDLVAWNRLEGFGSIEAAFVGADGTLGAATTIATGASSAWGDFIVWRPNVAGAASGYVVTYGSSGGEGASDVYAASLDLDGTVTRRDRLGAGLVAAPVAVASGFWAFWVDAGANVVGLAVPPSGAAAPLSVATASSREVVVSAASDGARALLTWVNGTVNAALFDPATREAGPTVVVSTTAQAVDAPRAMFDGARYWVVWREAHGPSIDLYARRLAGDGTLVDAAPVPVEAPAAVASASALAPLGQGRAVVAYGAFDAVRSAVTLRTRLLAGE